MIDDAVSQLQVAHVVKACVLPGGFPAATAVARRPAHLPSPFAHVDRRAPLWIRLGLPQHLVGDRGGVALPEQEEAEQVDDGVSLRSSRKSLLCYNMLQISLS